MIRLYGKIECPYCEQVITNNGLGKISHYRKHVREGLLIERRDYKNRCMFISSDVYNKNDMFDNFLKQEK